MLTLSTSLWKPLYEEYMPLRGEGVKAAIKKENNKNPTAIKLEERGG